MNSLTVDSETFSNEEIVVVVAIVTSVVVD